MKIKLLGLLAAAALTSCADFNNASWTAAYETQDGETISITRGAVPQPIHRDK